MRNDIYVTLLQGEFDRGKKKTPKNVEVILSVHDDEGNPMEVNKQTRTYNTQSDSLCRHLSLPWAQNHEMKM